MAKYSVSETRRTRRLNQSSYGASGQRSTLGYWVPLALTVTAATIGLAAWIWSERKDDEEESSSDEHYNSGGNPPPGGYASMSGGLPPGPGPGGYQGPPMSGPTGPSMSGPPMQGGPQGTSWQGSRDVQTQSTGGAQSTGVAETTEESGLVARVSRGLGMERTPSPGQAYNWASRNISTGVAAAAAAVGGALGYSETNRERFEDHERWSEEAEQRDSVSKRGLQRRGTADEYMSGNVSVPRSASTSASKRKTVAIVLSSVEHGHEGEDIGHHKSILSYLPEHVNRETTRVFVLIYAPDLTTHPLSPSATNPNSNRNSRSGSRSGSPPGRRPSQSMASSFSYIGTDEAAHTPGEYPRGSSHSLGGGAGGDPGILASVDPNPIDESTSSLYKTLHNQAMHLVDRDTMLIPFTSHQGHKHILKSIQPEIVYMQESLCGSEGEVVAELGGWVRSTVVVIGDEGGLGGLVDTDTEDETARKRSGHGEKWWKREEMTGLGRGVAVVESLRVGEDWRRRVGGED